MHWIIVTSENGEVTLPSTAADDSAADDPAADDPAADDPAPNPDHRHRRLGRR